MLTHRTTIFVDDALPQVADIRRSVADRQVVVQLHLVPRWNHDDLISNVTLYGTLAELRDWIGQVGLAVAEAEHQALAEAANGEPVPIERIDLNEIGTEALGGVCGL